MTGGRAVPSRRAPFLTGFTASLYYISQCLFVCPLPFFSATAEPFALKFGRSPQYGVGKTTKHFDDQWMHN